MRTTTDNSWKDAPSAGSVMPEVRSTAAAGMVSDWTDAPTAAPSTAPQAPSNSGSWRPSPSWIDRINDDPGDDGQGGWDDERETSGGTEDDKLRDDELVPPVPTRGEARPSSRNARKRKGPGVRLVSSDRDIVIFLARVKCGTISQVARAVHRSESAIRHRLPSLVRAGVVQGEWHLHGRAKLFRATTRGCKWAGVELPVTPIKPGHIQHTLALTDLVILLESQGRRVLTDREVRSQWSRDCAGPDGLRQPTIREGDTVADVLAATGGARSKRNPEALPDLVIVLDDGRKVAVELERTRKSRKKVGEKLALYVRDPAYTRVWWYVAPVAVPLVRNAIAETAGATAKCQVVEWECTELAGTPLG